MQQALQFENTHHLKDGMRSDNCNLHAPSRADSLPFGHCETTSVLGGPVSFPAIFEELLDHSEETATTACEEMLLLQELVGSG